LVAREFNSLDDEEPEPEPEPVGARLAREDGGTVNINVA
jgi:hypothetical protein